MPCSSVFPGTAELFVRADNRIVVVDIGHTAAVFEHFCRAVQEFRRGTFMHAHGENRAGHLEFFVRVQEQIGERVRCIRSVRIHTADQDVLTPVVDRVRLIRLQRGGEAEAFANAALLRRTRQFFLVFYIVFLRIELCAVVRVQCKAVDQLLRFFQRDRAALAVHLKIRVQNAVKATNRDV